MLRLTRFAAASGVSRIGKAGVKRTGSAAAKSAKKPTGTTAAGATSAPAALARKYAIAPGSEDDDLDDVLPTIKAPSTAPSQKQAAQQQKGATAGGSGQPDHHQHHHSHDHRSAGKLHFDATKAGLQHVNKDYVEQVIQEASRGSAFYQKEQRLEETRRRKAEELQQRAKQFNNISADELRELKTKVNTLIAELESTRDLRRRYIHIDMDMFYAAVEEKKRPSLRGKPFGVGAMPMLSTTNYIARQYGVRSGMPGFIGKKLCPELIIVPNDFPAYKREAARVHSIASRYDAQFVSVGLDELTMDVTKYLEEFPAVSAADIAHDFRDEVFLKTQLTSSGGIGPTSILAKIASNVNKPNGQHEITLLTREDVMNYVKDIPLRKIPGIGYAQELTLGALDIHTCGDLLKHKYLLAYLFKERTLTHYLSIGLGVAETFSQRRHHTTQSLGKEMSFYEPLPSPEAFTNVFRTLMNDCHVRCVREHLKPRVMRLVLKYRTFDTQQFSVQLPTYTNDLKMWIEASQKLLEPHLLQHAELRLVGVRLERFENGEHGEGGGGGASGASVINPGNYAGDVEIDVGPDAERDEDRAGRKPRVVARAPATEAAHEKMTEDADDEAAAEETEEEEEEEEEHDNDVDAEAEAPTKGSAAGAGRAEATGKKKTPIPVSKFLSKAGPVRAAPSPSPLSSGKKLSKGKSLKSARKILKKSSGGLKRKLHKRR